MSDISFSLCPLGS